MKKIVFHFMLVIAMSAHAGWRVAPGDPRTSAWRFEDVYFPDNMNGWLVNMSGQIFNSTDAGETWQLQAQLPATLRSVEFLDSKVGIVGSISDHSVYRTEDGGKNWIAVDPSHTFFKGVCGISHVGNTFFAAGRFSADSTFYKSTDKGKTWTKKSLSHLAVSLVDVVFLDEKTGFITGKGVQPNQGAVLLKTVDGGENWVVHYQTGFPLDHHIWKLQFVNKDLVVGSIWSADHVSPAYMIRSDDGGKTFIRLKVSQDYFYVEGIGFYDSHLGWMGGGEGIHETRDGGLSWTNIGTADQVNRFFRLGNKMIAVGKKVYIYEP